MSGLLTIGEVARRSGVAASALRFYEERGLIRSERAGSGHRRYRAAGAAAHRVHRVRPAHRPDAATRSAAELARLPPERAPDRRDWARLTRAWTARIDQRIAELERLRESLSDCIGCGCLSLDRCKLANPDDRAARQGPGPRRWLGDAEPCTSAPGARAYSAIQ